MKVMSGKKRKLNSNNPKYITQTANNQPVVKEKRLISNKGKIKAYAIFLENDKN
jgi:hypothetical protein